MMLLAVPAVASASAPAFLGERVTAVQVVGALVVLAAIAAILAQAGGEAREELAESAAGTDAP